MYTLISPANSVEDNYIIGMKKKKKKEKHMKTQGDTPC